MLLPPSIASHRVPKNPFAIDGRKAAENLSLRWQFLRTE